MWREALKPYNNMALSKSNCSNTIPCNFWHLTIVFFSAVLSYFILIMHSLTAPERDKISTLLPIDWCYLLAKLKKVWFILGEGERERKETDRQTNRDRHREEIERIQISKSLHTTHYQFLVCLHRPPPTFLSHAWTKVHKTFPRYCFVSY